jgi:hypothetical protein
MTNPNPAIVDADGGGREQVWPLPTDEQSLLDLIHLCFEQYWDEIWFGTLVQGAAWEVAAPNPPKRISMYDGYATVDFGAGIFTCASASTGKADPNSAGSAGVRAPSCIAVSPTTAPRHHGGRGSTTDATNK